MSLLLTGAKTITIAGTEMQCVEIYTGEAYTFPFAFKSSTGTAIDCTGWTVAPAAKWYHCDTTYPDADTIDISNLTLDAPQPSSGASANLVAAFTSTSTGVGYVYVPVEISGGYGSPNASPTVTVDSTNTLLVIVSLTVSRTDAQSGRIDVNREPIGMIVRYQ